MEIFITAIQKTPIPTVLIFAGLLFVLLGFTTKLGGIIEVSSEQKKLAIPVGLIILVVGLALTFMPFDRVQSPLSRELPPVISDRSIKSSLPTIKIVSIYKSGGELGTQRSKPLDNEVDFETGGELRIRFDLSDRACSEIRLYIFLDGSLIKTSDYFSRSTGVINLGPVSSGSHTLVLSPEGRVGGCNEGHLMAWEGKLELHTSS